MGQQAMFISLGTLIFIYFSRKSQGKELAQENK